MEKKKRVLNAIKRMSQDLMPTQIDYTPEMKKRIKNLLSIEDSFLIDEKLDNHIKYFSFDDKVNTDKARGI